MRALLASIEGKGCRPVALDRLSGLWWSGTSTDCSVCAHNTGWDGHIRKLAATFSKKIGVRDTSGIQVWLEKVILLDKKERYEFSSKNDSDSGSFASLIVVPMAPGQVRRYCMICHDKLTAGSHTKVATDIGLHELLTCCYTC